MPQQVDTSLWRVQISVSGAQSPSIGRGLHLPALDGLRGLAIVLVMIFHFTLLPDTGHPVDAFVLRVGRFGWIGVDLFFVLSGFLITGRLLDTRGDPGYFRTFYARRTLRIFPLYYVACAVLLTGTFAIHGSGSAQAHTVSAAMPWYLSYTANVLVAIKGAWAVTPFHTSHFWSLAVEEQFYLVWPLVVLLARQRLTRVCGVLIATAVVFRITMIVSGAPHHAMYVLTVARMDALAVGGLLAVAAREHNGLDPSSARWRMLRLCSLASVGPIFVLSAGPRSYFHPLQQAAGYTAIAIAFGALLIAVISASEASLLWRLSHSPFLRTCGRYSYGLYVVHFPIAGALYASGLSVESMPSVAGSLIPAQLVWYGIAGSLSFAAAWVSWHVIERPALVLKDRFSYQSHARR